ncbi:MAG: aromatic ring-hydroxylating dioxygenase subunit alpha [Pseudomonadota bacterium]
MTVHTCDTGPVRALPASVYVAPETFTRARDRIFFRTWQYVCHESQIPEPGDYVAFTLIDQDLFVIRGRDGGLKAFYNVCQHRAHPLVEGSGRTKLLVCPYHAWTYELDGRLRGAPGAKRTAGFDRSQICLSGVKVESLLGFVFVNLDPEAASLEETFPGVAEAARALCPDIETRVFADEHDAQEQCNWLVAVENYNECYHCGHVHLSFSNGVVDPESYDIQPFGAGPVLNHTAQPASGAGQWYDAHGSAYGSFFLFPAFSLQIYPGGLVNTYHWRPLEAGDTRVHRSWFSRDGVVDDQLQDVIDRDRDTTFAEDLALVKAVQRGLTSRGYTPGPLVIAEEGGIASEHSIAALHGWVREALA